MEYCHLQGTLANVPDALRIFFLHLLNRMPNGVMIKQGLQLNTDRYVPHSVVPVLARLQGTCRLAIQAVIFSFEEAHKYRCTIQNHTEVICGKSRRFRAGGALRARA